LRWLEHVWRDLRFGARSLLRTPGLTAVAVVSLALGILASTAIYSVLYGVVLHPFPYRDVKSLMSVKIWEPGAPGWRTSYTTDQFLEIAGRASIFDGVIASTVSDVLWTGAGDPQRLRGNHGTPNTFEVMGVAPLLGRYYTPADTEPVVVLGYRFWQRQFGGDPSVLGRRLTLDGRVRTVVGVMPKRFMWRGADVYLPVVFERGRVVEGVRFVHLLGRLKPGVSEAQAEADLRPIIEDLQRREPAAFPKQWRVGLLWFEETFPSDIREALWVLFGAVGLLLLIACANVSNLLLSKAAARQREMAIRASLGADRGRLIRQLLTESLLLGVTGGALGAALAFPGLKALLALVPPGTIPDESEIVINTPVLLFTLGVSVATALFFGLVPALHASRLLVSRAPRPPRSRSILVVGEVALSLVLLAGASLMIRTILAMSRMELGFRPERILTLRLPFSQERYPDAARRNAFLDELLRRVTAVPGVVTAAVNVGLHPLGSMGAPVEVVGSTTRDNRRVLIHQIHPDYTRALGIPLLQGRLFTASEVATRQHVAVVNQAFVNRYLADADPLGRLVRIPRLPEEPFQIIGIVRDTRNLQLYRDISPELYIPYTIQGVADRLVVLAAGNPASLAPAVRAQVYAIDKDQPVTEVRTLETLLDEWVFARPRFSVVLYSVFAALGLALALIGVYGVMSHAVAQQTQEIGVRIALGAQFRDITGMVLRRGLRLLAIGVALGLAGGLAATRLLRQQIWNVSPFDPLSFAAVSVLLLAAGLAACWWPARRAARVDPITALRYE
jgi:predicted permease